MFKTLKVYILVADISVVESVFFFIEVLNIVTLMCTLQRIRAVTELGRPAWGNDQFYAAASFNQHMKDEFFLFFLYIHAHRSSRRRKVLPQVEQLVRCDDDEVIELPNTLKSYTPVYEG